MSEEVIALNEEQQAVLDFVTTRLNQSVFITGDAGSGKSTLLNAIIKRLKERGVITYVTAATGIAALEIGGSTLHRYAGIETNLEFQTQLAHLTVLSEMETRNQGRYRFLASRIQQTRTLIIDETSMVSGELLDCLDFRMRTMRSCSSRPFGGVRVIFCGDFFQLPPVGQTDNSNNGDARRTTFAFQSQVWKELQPTCFNLASNHRQGDDLEYARILCNLRRGRLTEETKALLASRCLQSNKDLLLPDEASGETMIKIFPKNYQVHSENKAALERLSGTEYVLKSRDTCYDPKRKEEAKRIFQQMRAPEVLTLKVDAQVILLRNINAVFPSGILKYKDGNGNEVTEKPDANTERRSAMSEEGEVTIMLPNGLVGRVQHIDTKYETIRIAFRHPKYGTIVTDIAPFPFPAIVDNHGNNIAVRCQYPLDLAYAISVHKSQGQTIRSNVYAEMSEIFETGQAYVLLSRIRYLDQIYLKNIDFDRISANQKALEFYAEFDPISKEELERRKTERPQQQQEQEVRLSTYSNDNHPYSFGLKRKIIDVEDINSQPVLTTSSSMMPNQPQVKKSRITTMSRFAKKK